MIPLAPSLVLITALFYIAGAFKPHFSKEGCKEHSGGSHLMVHPDCRNMNSSQKSVAKYSNVAMSLTPPFHGLPISGPLTKIVAPTMGKWMSIDMSNAAEKARFETRLGVVVWLVCSVATLFVLMATMQSGLSNARAARHSF